VTARSGGVRLHNPVLLALVIVAIAATLAGGFVSLSPNRLVSGRPFLLWSAAGLPATAAIAGLASLLLGCALLPPRRGLAAATGFLSAVLLLLLFAAIGHAAARLAATAPPLARISPGAAFWVLVACAALALVDALQRTGAGGPARLLAAAVIAAALVAMAQAGFFEKLSLVREYQDRRDVFGAALLRHLVLVVGSVGPAVLIGVPLGIGTLRRPRLRGPVFGVLNLLQTVPSIALFGLLILPLSALAAALPALARLGIGGIGMAPALIALVLYALLPVVRNTVVGLDRVDAAVIDAGRGMGLSRRQLFWQVELPLALPVLLAGLRIVMVQAIGLAVVAALIGAGGLGTFVFEGLGQYAVDLVLLGALPAILLALAADFALQTLGAALDRRAAR
jgi:osmoprotectant transport system permease protein